MSACKSPPRAVLRAAAAAVLILSPVFSGSLLQAQETVAYFRQNCHSCHTIGGGRLTGPDLKDVSQRRDRQWLTRFVLNPKAAIDSGDPYASELLNQSRGVIMPQLAGLTADRVALLLDLIEEESKLEKSQFTGLNLSDQPFSALDIARGKDLFLGLTRLKNGGAACLSCHGVSGIGGLGGGVLGPDLTRAYERLGGRQALAAWMLAPATPTMRPVFKDTPLDQTEILQMVAFLEESARHSRPEDPSVARMNFFILGLAGAVAGLAIFGAAWKGRFRTVRRALVARARGEA